MFRDWNAARYIVHLESPDLENWTYSSKLEVGSDRIIDPSLYHMADWNWRVWYKDERDHSYIHYADSSDLAIGLRKGPPSVIVVAKRRRSFDGKTTTG